jgi:hypothetical protein
MFQILQKKLKNLFRMFFIPSVREKYCRNSSEKNEKIQNISKYSFQSKCFG